MSVEAVEKLKNNEKEMGNVIQMLVKVKSSDLRWETRLMKDKP